MKIKNNLIYSFIFTSFLTTFIIWNRFIRERFPKNVTYHQYWTSYDKVIIVICCLYLVLFFYYLLKYLKIIPRPQSKIKLFFSKIFVIVEQKIFFQKLLAFNDNIIINGPSNVYEFFYQFVYVKPFIWFCGIKLSDHFENNPFIPYIIGFIIPKLIIVLVLFFEITFFNQIHYFYKTLLLYFIPLIFKIVLYMINHHAKDYLDLLHEYFSFKLVNDFTALEITNKPFTDPIKLQKQQNLLYYAEKDWMSLQWMYSITAKINMEKDKYYYITNTIIYGIYAISFSIYLLKILGLF